MFKEILEVIGELLKRLVTSRLFLLFLIFTGMFVTLVGRLFDLQIVNGEKYLEDYVSTTYKTVTTPGTRGNIYDADGNLLAYNELAYSVTLRDTGAYRNDQSMNLMLYQLIRILEKHNETVEPKLEIGFDADGNLIYTSSSEAARKRFLRDYYGLTSVDKLDDADGRYPSNITAAELLAQLRSSKRYNLDNLADKNGNTIMLTDREALQIAHLRYALSLTAYRKYMVVTVSANVSQETVADVMEHLADLDGVDITESTVRVYNDAVYFAPIIGYTGKVQTEQLQELQLKDPSYDANDIVGRTGVEASMEEVLHGKKGVTNMFVDSYGQILQVEDDSTEPEAGEDIYLTIRSDLQKGIYHLLEQQLAGVLVSHLVNRDVTEEENRDSSKIKISIEDAYFQLINNNVLSLSHMEGEEAGPVEQQIYQKYVASREQILSAIEAQLDDPDAPPMSELPEDMRSYMNFIYTYLTGDTVGIIKRDKIDSENPQTIAWNEGSISLREYLYAGISGSWVDTTTLETEHKYSSADNSFRTLKEFVINAIRDDASFTKRIYRYLVNQDIVTGRELCLALYSQGVLPYDEEQIGLLTAGGADDAFQFMIDKITNLDITPAQLALDPCTAGCTVVDIKTGKVLAVVTYPSYDNNRMSGSVDAAYFNQLNNDLSRPFYNNATQALKAPGSTFKPITAIAALEEHAVTIDEEIECTGRYTEITNPIRCWIYPGKHGQLTIAEGIQESCNYFFAELAHRLSTDENGVYSTDTGLKIIQKYATMFGLDHTSGIEIEENSPSLSDMDPERSAMGQGTHAYTNVQLSRYVTALANRGNVFELSLIDHITDPSGTVVREYAPQISNQIQVADSTWDTVQKGMRNVIALGSVKSIFKDLEVDIVGKTGTAQENARGNHAFFISYGPYESPEISVTVNIPYGYSSAEAAAVAKNVYRLYYGYTDLDYIMNTGALDATNIVVGD